MFILKLHILYPKQERWLYERRRKVTKLLLFACSPVWDNRIRKKRPLKPLVSSVLHYLSLYLPRREGRGGDFALVVTKSHVLTKVFGCSLILGAFITFQFMFYLSFSASCPSPLKPLLGVLIFLLPHQVLLPRGLKGRVAMLVLLFKLCSTDLITHTLCRKIVQGPF